MFLIVWFYHLKLTHINITTRTYKLVLNFIIKLKKTLKMKWIMPSQKRVMEFHELNLYPTPLIE